MLNDFLPKYLPLYLVNIKRHNILFALNPTFYPVSQAAIGASSLCTSLNVHKKQKVQTSRQVCFNTFDGSEGWDFSIPATAARDKYFHI